jgi:hypothetical protein
MKTRTLLAFGSMALGLTMLTVTPAVAHHSFEAEYDGTKTGTFTGVVTKMDWVNPHAFIYMNFKDESGTQRDIRFEMGPPYALVRGGWKKDTVKIGDKITVTGAALAKDPKNNWAGSLPETRLVLASGDKLPMR